MSKVRLAAFEARQTGEPLSGGTVSYGDGRTLDVVEALAQREDGVIVVPADSHEEQALAAYPLLKRTSVPKDAIEAAEKAAAEAERPKVSKAVARKADELGVDLSQVEGTGSKGNITVKDVAAAAASGTADQADSGQEG